MFSFFKKHSAVVIFAALVIAVIAGIAARAASRKNAGDTAAEQKPLVRLINVSDYSQNSRTVAANGTVESLQQVDLKSQAGGKITSVNVKVGDEVRQGQVLAAIDQSSAAAALTSARGALEQAQASYNKLLAGASSEQINAAQVAVNNAEQNLENTKAQQDTAVENAYSTLLNTSISAVVSSSNIDTVTPAITGTYAGSEQGSYAISLYATGSGLKFQTQGLEMATGDVKSQPVALGAKGLYIQFNQTPAVSDTWTVAIPNTYAAGYVADNNAYQAALKTRESALSAAQAQLSSAQAALAQQQAQARPADIQAAQAQILTAQGQLQAAQAAYDNTFIRAPFSGTVSALSVKFADIITPGQKVATVVNQGGLQVKVFVSGADLPFISANSPVAIGDSKATGTVTNAAPSVDAGTRTAEVDIAVADPASAGLTVGQNVAVTIMGSPAAAQGSSFVLPIQAVKLTSDGKSFVYTVGSDGKAHETEVETGTVDGEHVEVTGGLAADMKIVSNAYDVSDGDTVDIHN